MATWKAVAAIVAIVVALVGGMMALNAYHRHARQAELDAALARAEYSLQSIIHLQCQAGRETDQVKCAQAFLYLVEHPEDKTLTYTSPVR